MTTSPDPTVDPTYLEWIWNEWKNNPSSVSESWQHYLSSLDQPSSPASKVAEAPGTTPIHVEAAYSQIEKMIQAYRSLGHLSAHLNPLAPPPIRPDYLEPSYYHLDLSDNTPFTLPTFSDTPLTVSQIHTKLQNTYTRSLGADYYHIQNLDERQWLETHMERCENKPVAPRELKRMIFHGLCQAEGFERFLHRRYLGQKRFSLEGLDSLIPMLHNLSNALSGRGAEEICIGMAHRGRLSVLVNFMGKPMEHLIKNFEQSEYNPFDIDGDVKYHIGFASEIQTQSNRTVRVYLAPNPSHLESVSPVIKGFVKGRQRLTQDTHHKKIIPVILHGDASFCGQGVVTEMLNLSGLNGYTCGGSIHIILNNQVGFTTSPDDSRSCRYPTDLAKFIDSPVIHVNADDPEACVWATELAVGYRDTFHKDVFIDLVGYRRHGHNESDEPAFTQPLMYEIIKKHPTVFSLYSKHCTDHKVLQESKVEEATAKVLRDHQKSYRYVKELDKNHQKLAPPSFPPALASALTTSKVPKRDFFTAINTATDKHLIEKFITALTTTNQGFTPHPKVVKVLKARAKMPRQGSEEKGQFDWATAELIALASLAYEKHHVRLTGQDVQRGTFSSRHAAITDIRTGQIYDFFSSLTDSSGNPVSAEIINSPLSELGCLGFEFGYAVADPKALVLWEAQFGDFANGAQIIIDQFLAASEAKWQQTASCVMLLPHGYEGQGPEHSSARLERYLQLCGGGNLQVVNCSTPAQHFHALRRQAKRPFKKCLIAMTPKSLLRDPLCTSSLADFTESSFKEVIDDPKQLDTTKVQKMILCSGKVYYDALKYRLKNFSPSHALVRIEQLYPFPEDSLMELAKKYYRTTEILWLQEEPQNMGGWSHVRTYLEELFDSIKISYVGRKASGSTAEGSKKAHLAEQDRIIKQAFGDICYWPQKKIS